MNKLIVDKILQSDTNLGSLVLRVPVGIVLAAHGAQKLFGWFGGYGLEGTGQWMASIGLEPGYLMAFMAGSAEFFGGLALIFGFLTRPAAAISAFTMLVAIFSVHFSNGLFMSNNGYEFALSLFAATLALTIQGSGSFAIDNTLSRRLGKHEKNQTNGVALKTA
ncbi:DoxX family protein [Agarilytica rhodophyticola]|uniref:DoxX family protein n=1 Tax=Agarilytica rhodophyticola TaxID=1737490 RepID=UPI000B348F9E|nr:DoxX family protein [Agarilytica rhodophyticola]